MGLRLCLSLERGLEPSGWRLTCACPLWDLAPPGSVAGAGGTRQILGGAAEH
jgi:hypothetical protein